MKAQQYAEALFQATHEKHDDAELERIVANFSTLVAQRGHKALMPAVVREFEKLLSQRTTATEFVIRVAKERDVEVFAEKIHLDAQTLEATQLPRRVLVDENLVGGYEVRAQGKRIDRTYKRSLLTLYTDLITNNQ